MSIRDYISKIKKNKIGYNGLMEIFNKINNEINRLNVKDDDESFTQIKKLLKNKAILHEKLILEIIRSENKKRDREKNIYNIYEKNSGKYYVIGDIHSDDKSLKNIVNSIDFINQIENKKNNINLIFLGDYIDRGGDHIGTIDQILALKYSYPENIYLLKGNHDVGVYNQDEVIISPLQANTGKRNNELFFDWCSKILNKKYDYPKKTIVAYKNFFDKLSYLGFIKIENFKIMFVHGGLPRVKLKYRKNPFNYNFYQKLTMEELEKGIKKDFTGMTLQEQMVWSDPSNREEWIGEYNSTTRFKYFKKDFYDFTEKFDIDLVIRGHEQRNLGYSEQYKKRLLTVFSTGGENNTKSYYEKVTPDIIEIDSENKIIKVWDITEEGKSIERIDDIDCIFDFKDIKKNRREFNKLFDKEKEQFDETIDNNLSVDTNVISLKNLFGNKHKRYIYGTKEIISTSDLKREFYGVNPKLDVKLQFFPDSFILKNLSKNYLVIENNKNKRKLAPKGKTELVNEDILNLDEKIKIKINLFHKDNRKLENSSIPRITQKVVILINSYLVSSYFFKLKFKKIFKNLESDEFLETRYVFVHPIIEQKIFGTKYKIKIGIKNFSKIDYLEDIYKKILNENYCFGSDKKKLYHEIFLKLHDLIKHSTEERCIVINLLKYEDLNKEIISTIEKISGQKNVYQLFLNNTDNYKDIKKLEFPNDSTNIFQIRNNNNLEKILNTINKISEEDSF